MLTRYCHHWPRDRDGSGPRILATIRFAPDGTVTVTPKGTSFEPTTEEAEAIKAEAATVQLPHLVPVPDLLESADTPWQIIAGVKAKTIYNYFDTDGTRIMLRTRVDKEDGSKFFVPWTFWSDGQWRDSEPRDRPLPFWGMERLTLHPHPHPMTVYIHEGEKAAQFATKSLHKQVDGKDIYIPGITILTCTMPFISRGKAEPNGPSKPIGTASTKFSPCAESNASLSCQTMTPRAKTKCRSSPAKLRSYPSMRFTFPRMAQPARARFRHRR